MIIADSSFLVAFFNKKDSQHQKAIDDMKKFDETNEEFVITEHVLGETATVLLYQNGLEAAVRFIDFSREKCSIQGWDADDFQASLSCFKEQARKLSYIDSTLVYLSGVLRCRVATYDENILKEIERKNSLRNAKRD